MDRRPIRAVLVSLVAALLITATPVQGASAVAERELLVSIAQSAIGAKFRLGMEGPTRFDCSGLVWYVYSSAGLAERIGGKRMRAREFQRWFRQRGMLDARNPQVGDLVFYGNPAKHTGIVSGFNKRGKALVISALTSGVAQHKYDSLNVRFHSFGHVTMGSGPEPTPKPTPSPTPTPTPSPTPQPTSSPIPEPTASPAP